MLETYKEDDRTAVLDKKNALELDKWLWVQI